MKFKKRKKRSTIQSLACSYANSTCTCASYCACICMPSVPYQNMSVVITNRAMNYTVIQSGAGMQNNSA